MLGSSDVIQFLAVNQNFLIFLFYLHVNASHNIKRYLFVNSDIVVKINGMLLCMYLFRWDFYGNLPCGKKQELVCMWGKKQRLALENFYYVLLLPSEDLLV